MRKEVSDIFFARGRNRHSENPIYVNLFFYGIRAQIKFISRRGTAKIAANIKRETRVMR